MILEQIDRRLLLTLRSGAFCCFAGWTWVHFYWEGPYKSILWQDATFDAAARLGISWETFVGSGANDGIVQRGIAWIAWLYLLCSIAALTVRQHSRTIMAILLGGSGLLTVLAYAKYVSAQRQLPMLIEHGGQILSPVVLVLALTLGVRHRATVGTALAACVMTFAGHGAYALGVFWPTPANFHGMTSVILGLDYETTRMFLQMAGVLDLLVCVGLFIPTLRRASALYAALWGFLTAVARPVAGMSLSLNYWGSDQYLHETILRTPHFMLPLFLFFLWKKNESSERFETEIGETESPSF